WITDSSNYYNNDEESWVESPCFDFSGLVNPHFELNYFAQFWDWSDGAALQYTLDGNTWIHIGNYNHPIDPDNWYNHNFIMGLGYSGSIEGWTSAGYQWQHAEHPMTFLAGEPYVKFRIVFGSNQTYNNSDGFAFDDISIFQPPNMTYDSSAADHPNLDYTVPGRTDEEILRILIKVNSSTNPLAVTDFYFNTTGTTSSSDIDAARIYFTGDSNEFDDQDQFGNDVYPTSPFNISGSQSLSDGENYFWLVYDVSMAATIGNFLDALCDSFIVGGISHVPDSANPAGSREIITPMAGLYTIDPLGSGTSNYLSFNNAVSDLLQRGVSAAVTFDVASGTYTEQVVFTEVENASATNEVIFQSASGDSTDVILAFSPTSNDFNYTIFFNSASFIRFKKMNIGSTGGTFSRVIQILGNSVDLRFRNNQIMGPQNPWSTSFQNSLVFSNAFNKNNLFKDNLFSGGSWGIAFGVPFPGGETGLEIVGNTFSNQSYRGIYVMRFDAPVIKNNTITTSIGDGYYAGIEANSIQDDFQIIRNKISIYEFFGGYSPGTKATTYGGSLKGIYIPYAYQSSKAGDGLVANNFVDIYSSAGSFSEGISAYDSEDLRIIYNSVNLYGNQPQSKDMYLDGQCTGITILNNIFSNPGNGYAIFCEGAADFTSDYNDLFTTGPELGAFNVDHANCMY
ncbi:MAG: BNR-repeat neuraminidase N-terminal domain-containing protein, partial [Bacteroidota bacterium]|nr:BNR-repeat neuraminidase N-terminal domain-containing protein [Bacteroidota bacterium]